jgi:hypothetical protein
MKTAAFAMALLLGGAAFAQSPSELQPESAAYDGDGVTAPFETEEALAGAAARPSGIALASDVVQAGNASPERDARGIRVISASAVVPPGWNGVAAAAMGGPLLDAETGAPAPAVHYPPCTATLTDRCLQRYERRRR